ncbi:M14 family metallopeptidase [Parapedobacter koreensis]|uniref:Zinc carboxypeptidase n=1 Tax=Parapedobacter koreensis TaxID=332977 RepID=A0A1H7LGR2_9SPHI|nr:M14 metallopeptidase family protein [Parapedobacter koreensis]SEK98123.1 Zinc carboxypeptidase [Parapedobacter koreensis]
MLRRTTLSLLAFILVGMQVFAQHIPSPKEHFGFTIGDDYKLANYTQTEAYFKKVAALSDRVKMELAGKTSEGRDMHLIIVSSPENLAKIDTYKEISQKFARAEISEAEAKELSLAGKPVVWIDGGLHATEVVATHQLFETFYQLVSRNDPENLRILDEVVILLFHCNPDGQELVSNWYMQQQDPLKRNKNTPVLYHKYVGHDNNRDFYMNNLMESTVISRLQYIDWNPQIIYNHHQSAPAGAVVAGPPYRDPFNYVLDPVLMTGIDGVAAAMINRLNVEKKPGYTRLSGSVFSTWWNGGLRTAPYYHNSIGILTEIIGDPTPSSVPLIPERLIPNNGTPNPVTPQEWHFKTSIDYSVSLNYAILDYASRFGDELLFNMYTMGRNSIERGSTDYWPLKPSYVAKIESTFEADKAANKVATEQLEQSARYSARDNIPASYFEKVFSDPVLRDPRGYIIPADQTDFPRAVQFVNALIKSGILIHKATSDFTVAGKSYPAGSYVVKAAQAFRPHVLDMFEPQDHPNDFEYPGGPPVRPYDAAGWTLAYQFGIDYDRIQDAFDGPFEAVPYGQIQAPPAQTVGKSSAGFLLSSEVNNSFVAANKLLAAGINVSRIQEAYNGAPAGSFYVPANGLAILQKMADTLGIKPIPASKKPGNVTAIKPSRIALFDSYGGSMPSGWVRWLLEQYHFDTFSLIFPQEIDKGNLIDKYDIILFIGGGIPPVSTGDAAGMRGGRGPNLADIPEKYHHMIGNITAEKSIPQLKAFVEAGGTLFTVGSSTALAYHLGLPVKNALVEVDKDGRERPLRGEQYYAPGSIHQVIADTTDPAGWGMPETVSVMSSNSPVFKLEEGAKSQGVKPLAWYGDSNPLLSGWVWGADYLKNGITAFSAPVGKGKLYAFGPEITFRAQPHGTFKWLFNQLYVAK